MKYHLLIIILLPLVSFSLTINVHAQTSKGCQSCDRHGKLTEFTNPGNPDYEKQNKEWNECMTDELGEGDIHDPNDPRLKAATEKCSSKVPPKKWYCYPSMVHVYIGELWTSPCFHMLSREYYVPGLPLFPEYIFTGSYEGELEGGRIIEYDEGYKRPVVARMSIQMYYNGDSPELVKEWSSENTINDPRAVFNKLKMPKKIAPLIEEFERRPVSCEVEIPAQEELCENGTGEIVLSGFKDQNGNPSKSFNRILVSIYKGAILNGENSDLGPDYKIFIVGEGTIKVKYRPPADTDDGYEWLRVYNSCDILPPSKYPYSRTVTDKMIIDQHFPIMCGFYSGQITITKSWDYTKHYDNYSATYTGKQTVNYNGIFKPSPYMEGMEGQPMKMFTASSVTGTWTHNEQRYCEGGGGCGDCKGLVYEEYGSGSVSDDTKKGLLIITNVFPTDNKEVAQQMAQFGMVNWYDVATPSENVETRSRTKHDTEDSGCQWSNSTSTTNIIGAQVRYKLKDINLLQDNVSWSSSKETIDVSVTNMTEAIYDQEPFDPEKDGSDYTYTITWNLKAL